MDTNTATQPPFNLKTLNLPPPQPPPSISELRRISASLSQFLRDYDDLHSHISSVNAALDEKLSLHYKGDAVNFNDSVKNVLEGPVVEPHPRHSVSECVSVVSERKRNECVVDDDDVRIQASSDNLISDSDRVVNDVSEVGVSEGVKNYEQNDRVVNDALEVVVNDVLKGVVVLDGKCEGSDCDSIVSDDLREIVLEGSESECERGDGNVRMYGSVKKDEEIIDALVKMEESDCAEIITDVSEAGVSEQNLNGSESDHIVTEAASECEQGDGDVRMDESPNSPDSCKDTDNEGEKHDAAENVEETDDDRPTNELEDIDAIQKNPIRTRSKCDNVRKPQSSSSLENSEETVDEDGEIEALKKPEDADYDRIVTELPEDIDVVPKPRAAIDSEQSYDKPQSPNSLKNHLDEIDVSMNPEDKNHEQTDVSMEANVSEKYEEMDILKNPAESDVLEKPEEIDITKNPEETDVSKKRKKTDVSKKLKKADVSDKRKNADVSEKRKKADVSEKRKKADVSEKPEEIDITKNPEETDVSKKCIKADISKKLKKANVSEKRKKADVSEKPEEIDITKNSEETDVSKKRKKADVSEKRKKADVSEKRKNADVSEKRKKADVSEKTRYVEILKNPKPAVSELEMLCKSMSGRELKKYVVKHISNIDKLRTELSKALKLAINPAKLVLDSIGTYFLQSSKTYHRGTKDQNDVREASVLILECFVMIRGDGIQISREDKAYAAENANRWKTRMNNERGLKYTEETDARGLLLFISGFGISDRFFSTVDIMNLIRASNVKGISNILRRSIVLMPKIPELIDMMVMSKREVEAADIAYTFGLEDKRHRHPLTILTKFLRSIIDDIESGSRVPKTKAMKQQLDDLTSVKECLKSHNIDPSKVLPEFKIDEEIHRLKKELKLQVQKRKVVDIKSLSNPNHQDAKRTCFDHQTMPRGISLYNRSMQPGYDYLDVNPNLSGNYTPMPLRYAPALPRNITNSVIGGLAVPSGNSRGRQDDTQPSFPVCIRYIPSGGFPSRRGPCSDLYACADVVEEETRCSRAVGSGTRYSYVDKVAYAYLCDPSELQNIMPDETGPTPSQGPHSHFTYRL